VFAHVNDALENIDYITDKIDTIKEILAAGLKVDHYIIRHKLTEEDAFTVESVLIDFLTHPDFNKENILTNLVAGHHQWDEGIMTVDEIKQIYDCEPICLKEGHKLLMVNLNRTYKKGVDLYNITRGDWKVCKSHADQGPIHSRQEVPYDI
jgi:hypothetical protein